MKNILTLFVSLLVSISLLTSCITEKLWEKPEYTEKVSQFLMTEDGSNLVVVGKKYHYIFPTTPTLKHVLTWQHRNELEARFGQFTVRKDGTISGSYSLLFDDKGVTEQDKKWLKSNEFVRSVGWKEAFWLYKGNLDGQRYLAEKELPGLQKFPKTYSIVVTDQFSFLQKGGRIAMTPITVTTDGALVIVGVAGITAIAGLLVAPMVIGCIASENGGLCGNK